MDEREIQRRGQELAEQLAEWISAIPGQPIPTKIALIALGKVASSYLYKITDTRERDEVAERFGIGIRHLAQIDPPRRN